MDIVSLRAPFFLLLIAIVTYPFLDRSIVIWISLYVKPYFFLKGATLCISPPLYLTLSGIGLVLSCFKKRAWVLPFFEIFMAQVISGAFVRLFKILIGRARPDLFLKEGIYGFYGIQWGSHYHAFPSGHTMAAITLAISLSYLFPKLRRFHLFGGAVFLILSRILLLKHYLSDILGTAAIALVLGKAIHQLTQFILRKTSKEVF